MVTPIIMPKFGQMTEDSAIVEWLKKEGDKVAKGDMLFLVETDKSVMEVESFSEGTLLKIVVGVGVSVPVQSVVGLSRRARARPSRRRRRRRARAAERAARRRKPSRRLRGRGRARRAAARPLSRPRRRLRPRPPASASARARRRWRKECVIDPRAIVGSGPDGRIVEKDVKAYLEANDYASLRVSPAAKALAAKEGLDLIALGADNAGKRIEVADVERAVAEKPKPMSKMRQIIAQRLTQSVITAPHFYVTVEVDMTEALAHRARLKAAGRALHGHRLHRPGVGAGAEGIPRGQQRDRRQDRPLAQPRASRRRGVNLEQGLVVPVVRDADELTLAELNARAKELVDKARAGSLAPDEMSGIDLHHLQHGHARRRELHRDHQSRRIGDPGGVQHDQEAGRARRRDRRAADHEDDAVVRSSPDRWRDGGPLRQQHQDQARG